MKKKKKNFLQLVLIPRIFIIVLIIALYLFVGEIFSEEFQWSHPWHAFIPGSAYLFVAIIAWKNSGLGGAALALVATALFFAEIVNQRALLAMYILIAATFIIGFLFIFFREKKGY